MTFCNYIGFGICSKYYLFILGSCIFKFLKQSLLNYYQINFSIKTALLGFMPILNSHLIISSIYTYISFIIFSLIIFPITIKLRTNEKNLFKLQKSNTIELLLKGVIHNKKATNITIKKILKVVGVCVILVIQMDLSKIIYLYDFSLFNFWTFYVVFILIFMKRYFVVNLHKHQKYSMLFVIFICSIILLVTTFIPYNNLSEKNSYQKVKDITGSYFYFIPIVLIFIAFTCMFSYFIVYSKVLMEVEFFPPYLLILITGVTGLVLNCIALMITSFIECKGDFIKNNICYVFNEEGKAYYDNILIYFSSMRSAYDNDETRSNFFIEIFALIPLYLIFSFLEFLCQIFAVYYMNPNYILIKDPIFFGLQRLGSLIYNLENINEVMYLSQFFLLESAELFGLFGYLVYLEIIELRFCNLDENLKRNILNRTYEANLNAMKEMNMLTEDKTDDGDERKDSFDNIFMKGETPN